MSKKLINFLKNNYILIILFTLVVMLTVFIFTGVTSKMDYYILTNISKIRTDFLTKLMILISEIGSWYFIIVLLLTCILLIKKLKDNIILVINSLGVLGLNYLIKLIFRRVRPTQFMMIKVGGYSFPSGHAMVSFSIFTTLLIFINKYIKNKNIKLILQIICLFLIIFIPISRVYLGVHYFTDVVTGMLISAIIILIEKKYLKVI